MKEKEYYASRSKLLVKCLIAIAIAYPCVSLVNLALSGGLSGGGVIRIGILFFIVIAGLFALFYFIIMLIRVGVKPKVLTLSENGIETEMNGGMSVGIVHWNNVTKIKAHKVNKKSKICIYVNDISTYVSKDLDKEIRAAIEINNIALIIDDEETKEDIKTIFEDMIPFYNKFKNNENKAAPSPLIKESNNFKRKNIMIPTQNASCLLYTSDAADD